MTRRARRWCLCSGAGLALLLLSACGGGRRPQADSSPPFVFRALDLSQQDPLGRPIWSLKSPEARYDVRRRFAQADQPRGVIFRDGAPAFRLSARSGTVLNEGQAVLLEGGIRVEQLGRTPLLITAERARWFPRLNRLEIDRRPEVLDRTNRISARRARFAFDSRLLTLRDSPRLEHWENAGEAALERRRGAPQLTLEAFAADWNTGSGELRVQGPLRGRRREPARSPAGAEQSLSASRLEGNTLTQQLRLFGPVRLQDPLDGTDLNTGDVRLDLGSRQASSDSACLLRRGGDSLQADSCRWNWDSQMVEARGDVQLRRRERQQFSRGGTLSGRLGRDGFLSLTNPGGRVLTRLRLPQPATPLRPQLQRPRPAPEPIRL